jgi:DNA invertase Pin-like site-specific DNA recombinase
MKVALYSRTSTDKQDTGLEAQQRALHDWLKYKGITDYLEFSDAGVSGKLRSRPGFDRMMAAARAGEIGTILVYSYSRFARNTRHLLESVEEFDKLGIAFVSLRENVDTTTASGRLVFTIFAGLAQYERELIVERVNNGLKNAREKGIRFGRPLGGGRPLGKGPAKPPRPDQAILELHRAGEKPRAIAAKLGISRGAVLRALKTAQA